MNQLFYCSFFLILFKLFSWLLLVINDYSKFSQFLYINVFVCLIISRFIRTICQLFFPLPKNDSRHSVLLYIISHLLYYLYSFYRLRVGIRPLIICCAVRRSPHSFKDFFAWVAGRLYHSILSDTKTTCFYQLLFVFKCLFLLVLGKFLLFRFWY
jgi:hypothetical protein